MKAELFQNSKYDGTTWVCRPLPFTSRVDDVTFYNDNPVVYGFPREMVTIGGVKYKAADLVEETGYEWIVVVDLLPNGEVKREGIRCPKHNGGCDKVAPDGQWDWMTNRCKECSLTRKKS